MKQYTKAEACQIFGCTPEQLQKQYKANAQTLRTMYEKAKASGKKVNNFTADQLFEMWQKYENLAK